ncbi:IS3 family transposase [Terasakiella pusilla]|uniref:IS3 family transposase n=1 Tax=Terasakiella pusilla TaxID=64973 RepID=UPI003AA802C3
MKRSKFNESQIAFILRQAEEGTSVDEVCRKAGISQQTYYRWRKKYGGLMPSEMKRLKQLEEENTRLKGLVADLSLDKAMLQDVIKRKPVKPARRRQIVDHLRIVWQVSIRRACCVLQAGRSTYHYKARRDEQAALRQRIKEIAETRVRYGYRRIHVLLKREGWEVNPKRVYRLYKEEGLVLRNKSPKRKVSAKLREDRSSPEKANDVWAMDFVSDQIFDGRRLRILTIVDAYSRFCPAIDVRIHYRGIDVVATLERVTKKYGKPKVIRVDNGPEFISKDLDLWAYLNGVTLDFSRPGKPTDNAFIESFNGSFRMECLNASWFLSLNEARSKCEMWRHEYNEVRPHSSIGNKAPIELINASREACLP